MLPSQTRRDFESAYTAITANTVSVKRSRLLEGVPSLISPDRGGGGNWAAAWAEGS